ncbi:MAG: sugar transferase [Solirubrobacteraceae bacterium]
MAGLASYPMLLAGTPSGALGVFMAALSLTGGVLLVDARSSSTAVGLRRLNRVFFVGSSADREALEGEVRERQDLTFVGNARIDEHEPVDAGALLAEIRAAKPSVLVLSDEALRSEQLVGIASALNVAGVRIRDMRAFFEQEFKKVAVSNLTMSWFLFDIAEIHGRRLFWIKRALEAAISALLLLLTVPAFPLIIAAIKLQSPGPAFFRQPRVGKGGRIFLLTKFRTMHPDPDCEHGAWACDAQSRIFRVGRILRKFRLDELPQLWDVVRGELSLVGPRPEQPEIVERLENKMQFYAARTCVRPGLTGWAQVNYGYGGSDEGALVKLQYDLYYLKRQSLGLDLRIMALTARAVLFGPGS